MLFRSVDNKQNSDLFKVGDDVEVYFERSDSESELTIKSFNKVGNGYRVVFTNTSNKEYTYIVNNEGIGEKITINAPGVFEITSEMIETEKKLKQESLLLWNAYNSKSNEQKQIQGRVPTFVISPIAETINISREKVDLNQENTYRSEPESEVGYKIIIPGHNTELYLIERTGNIEDLKTGRQIGIDQFKKGLIKTGQNIEKGSAQETIKIGRAHV